MPMKLRLYHRKPRRPETPPAAVDTPSLIPFFFEKSLPAAQSQSGFFRLPREIRDQIYDLLFDRVRNQYREGNLQFDVIYGPFTGDWRASWLRKWLLICKRFLAEALEQFYSKAQCLGYTGDQWWASPSPYRLISLYRIRRIIVDTPGREVHLVVGTPTRETPAETKGMIVPSFDTSYVARPGIKPLYQHLCPRDHEIKEIKLNLMPPKGWTLDPLGSVTEWSANLRSFEALGSTFERVEFRLYTPICARTSIQALQHIVTVYRVLQQELERVGMKMIGVSDKDEMGWSVRDWVHGEMRGWNIEIQKTPGKKAKRDVNMEGLRCWQDENTLQWYQRVLDDDGDHNNSVRFWTAAEAATISVKVWKDGKKPAIEKTANSQGAGIDHEI